MIDNALRDRVKEYYESHRLSFAQLSTKSTEIFNAKITVDQLKHWSTEDGGWKKAPIEDTVKLKIIADRIFLAIEEDERLDPKDLVALANVYLNYATKSPPDTMDDSRPTIQQIIDETAKAMKNGKLDK